MKFNKYTGEVVVSIGGRDLTMCLDWRALSAIKSQFGDDLFTRLTGLDLEVLADVLVIAFSKKHNDVTRDFIIDASPPVMAIVEALDHAVTFAYLGPDAFPTELETQDVKALAAKKKT
jgi:hypothetical protein